MRKQLEFTFQGYVANAPTLNAGELERWNVETQCLKGLAIDIIMRPSTPKATREQFGYYRAVILPFVSAQLKKRNGFSQMDESIAHEYLKRHFARRCLPNELEPIILPGSTALLTVDGFGDFIQRIDEFCLDYLGCGLPGIDESQGLRIRYSGEF